uniref:Uncharacterized protein n=1 Tax=Quercus lobata TaxID=97700 RepID=A0A7N2MEC4_QUELO
MRNFAQKVGAAPIDQKMRESRLRKFNRVQRRTINAVVGMSELIQVEGMKKAKRTLFSCSNGHIILFVQFLHRSGARTLAIKTTKAVLESSEV